MKRIEKNYNVQTGEDTIVERDETPDEKEERLSIVATVKQQIAEDEAKAAAKAAAQAKLAALGLTVADLEALGL